MKTWTEHEILEKLLFRNGAIDRAIIAIYDRKLAGLDTVQQVVYWNRWIRSGKKLSGNHLDAARDVAFRFVKQLTAIANEHEIAKAAHREAIEVEVDRLEAAHELVNCITLPDLSN